MRINAALKEILDINKGEYWVIIVYGIAVAITSLVIPLAIQTVVNIVSFGNLYRPLITISIIVFVALVLVSIFRIFQAIVVESVQQRLFADVGLRIAKSLPETKLTHFDNLTMPHVVNFFLEIHTVQKALASLLVNGLDVLFMAVFSLLLIAFYHPALLLFDIFLILGLILVVTYPYKNALKYALSECQKKHRLTGWFNEILNNIILFKTQNNTAYALSNTEKYISYYLHERKKHFHYILHHLIGLNTLYVVSNVFLIAVGGYLVMREQLSLGQLVASELVINSLLYGFLRLGNYMEEFYDLLASSSKLCELVDLPTEKVTLDKNSIASGENNYYSIACKDLEYYTTLGPIFSGLNIEVNQGEKVVIHGKNGYGKSIIADLLIGLREPQSGVIKINNIPLVSQDKIKLRQNIALVRNIDLLYGTIRNNLLLNKNNTTTEDIYKVLNSLSLTEPIESLELAIDTFISGPYVNISKHEIYKILIARAILSRPKLLILDSSLDMIISPEINEIIDYLKTLPCTLIVTTSRKDITNQFDKIVAI